MPGKHSIMLLLTILMLQACAVETGSRPVILITGADNEIGYTLAEEYAEQGWRVIATCRDPKNATMLQSLADLNNSVTIEALDVRNRLVIDALARKYAGTAIDVLVNNEELHPVEESAELGDLDFDSFDSYIAVNVTAPLKITESFVEQVAASEYKLVVTITSVDSSIANVQEPGDYFYRASKAAVNIIMVTMAPDLSERGIAVGLVAPLAAESSSREVLASQANELRATINTFRGTTSASLKSSAGQELAW